MNQRCDFIYKVILVGDINVGKTCYISRVTKNVFNQLRTKNTVGVEQVSKTVELDNGKIVKARIWDTSGQEKYRSITTAYFRECAGALLFFDLTNKNSFLSTLEWINEIKENSDKVKN